MKKPFTLMTNDTEEYSRGSGRHGKLTTRRGDLQTPFFMPDATRASVRGLTSDQLTTAGVHPMVVNTYHLMLQPGPDFLIRAGGIHEFMNWSGPLLSDSGGYQVYSLIHKNAKLGKITEEGAHFRSVIDGSKHFLSPEKAIEIQMDVGTDMMVVLDDPRPTGVPRQEHEKAVERTIRWAAQCKEEFVRQCEERDLDDTNRPLLFAVVQGGPFVDLRERCARELSSIGFDGYGFGGMHIGPDGNFMDEIMEKTAAAIPEDSPRFALGIGTPSDIVKCYSYGWDMFDCVIPTREGRHGRVFYFTHDTDQQIAKAIGAREKFYDMLNISNAKHAEDKDPISKSCDCYACVHHSRSYLRHLDRVSEPLGPQLVALHNLTFYTRLMRILAQEK